MSLRDPALADLVGNATRRAFVRVVDLCLAEEVDALILAGDLYDGTQTSMKTARFLAEQVRRLHEAGIATFVIRGNHDAMSQITRELVFPESVTVFGGRAGAIEIDRPAGTFPVAIHGLSFRDRHAPESLLDKYRPPVAGAVNIGILHTSLAGAPGHDNYAPCSVADLQAAGFDYWALGHIHKRSVVEGQRAVVMPGMPQGRDINEAGPKSVSLVTVADDRTITIEERVTSVAQFERVPFDVTGIEDWAELVRAGEAALAEARQGLASDHLVARLKLTGTTPLSWRLRRDIDLLKTDLDERAAAIGACWVESVEIDTRPDGAATATARPEAPLIELRRLIAEEVAGSAAFRMEASRIVNDLAARLPPESRRLFGTDEAAFEAAFAALIDEGTEDALARLHAGADDGET